jgi:muramidase (phage lysozyme)
MAGYSVTYSVVDNATKQIDAINRRITAMRAPMERMSRSVSRFVDVSGLRKVAQGFEWIGKTAATVFRTLSQIVPVMGAITGAASIAGMVKLVNSYADWSHQLVQNADDIGTTTQQLQQFQDATRLAGGNAGDMTSSLKALHTNLADFAIGRGNFAEVGQMANYLGVNLRDANGQIRSAADLMPELIAKIAALPDPANRARAATELFGAEGSKLVETFRQSHQSFAQWFTDAGRYTELTDDQKRSLQEFTEAQGRAGVAFDHLGQQISVVLARDFAPLLNRLSEFVEKHTPEIVAAVDRISQEFTTWLQGVDWSKVEAGINSLLDGLKWVINNLDTVKEVAEGIAVLFAAKWAIGIVASIAQVTGAIGIAGGTVGLLGGLGAVVLVTALIIDHWKDFGRIATDVLDGINSAAARVKTTLSDFWAGRHEAAPEAYPKQAPFTPGGAWAPTGPQATPGGAWAPSPNSNFTPGGAWAPPGAAPSGAAGAFTPTAPDLTPEGRGLLQTIATHESRGDYSALYGGGHFAGSQFPQWAGKDNSHAAGAYQFQPGTFAGVQSAHPEIKDFSPANQDRAAWLLAQTDYHRRTGRDLTVDLKDPMQAQRIASTLQPTWTSTNKPGWANELQRNLAAQQAKAAPPHVTPPPTQIAQAAPPPAPPVPAAPVTPPAPPVPAAPATPAAPVTVPPPTPPNGAVDVSITHKNPPPNSSVTATGSGSVNVAPVRVEHQDMASI